MKNTKIIEKVYALQKEADAGRVLDSAGAEEQAQMHIRKVEKIRGIRTWEKLKAQKSSDNKRSPSAKSPTLPGMDAPKISTPAKEADANTVPNSALPTGKNAVNAIKKDHFAEQCRSKAKADPSSKQSSQQKQIPRLKKKFHEATADSGGSEADFSEYDTDEVTVQVDSIEARAEETKSTKTDFGKKLPKHVTKAYLDKDQSPDVLYATVELELPDGSTKKLKGKVNTGAQVNLMNYMTCREIFGHDVERILHNSRVKLTGYGGKRFRNHGKFRIDCVCHNSVVGQRAEFYGSNLFSLKFTCARLCVRRRPTARTAMAPMMRVRSEMVLRRKQKLLQHQTKTQQNPSTLSR